MPRPNTNLPPVTMGHGIWRMRETGVEVSEQDAAMIMSQWQSEQIDAARRDMINETQLRRETGPIEINRYAIYEEQPLTPYEREYNWMPTTVSSSDYIRYSAGDVYSGVSARPRGETEVPRITTATKMAIMQAMNAKLMEFIGQDRARAPRGTNFGSTHDRWAAFVSEALWQTAIEPKLSVRRSKYEVAGWTKIEFDQPADFTDVMVMSGGVVSIACQHTGCAPDWFERDGSRIEGAGTFWMPFPLVEE